MSEKAFKVMDSPIAPVDKNIKALPIKYEDNDGIL